MAPQLTTFNARRAKTSPFPETWMAKERIEAIREDEMAEDIEFVHDMSRLCLLSEKEVRDYFTNGGEVGPLENTIEAWLCANVANVNHRKKLSSGMTAQFGHLREVCSFLAAHESEGGAFGALLSNMDVPVFEHRFMLQALAPLWDLACRRRLGPLQDANSPRPEHHEAHFSAWLRARLPPVGWGVAMAWEAEHELFVPRKPHAVVRLFTIGGISETSMSFRRALLHGRSERMGASGEHAARMLSRSSLQTRWLPALGPNPARAACAARAARAAYACAPMSMPCSSRGVALASCRCARMPFASALSVST